MSNITQEELNTIIYKHERWLKDFDDGERADLRGADLRSAYLRGADLRYANLNWINTQDLTGLDIIAVQVDTTRKNNLISYYPELDIITTGCFQGSLEELEKRVEITHKDNKFLLERYKRAIDYIKNEVRMNKEM